MGKTLHNLPKLRAGAKMVAGGENLEAKIFDENAPEEIEDVTEV